jgi:mannose-1-phosphate guanylyltransferase
LILAGGDGARLQDLTREISGAPIPKQYCRLLGTQSLLEATLRRTQYFAPRDRTIVVVNRDHLPIAGEQLHGLSPENILVQPCNRDTGPGLLFALLHLARRDPAAVVAVFPSDHYVGNDRAFIAHVERGARIVKRCPDKMVILGIHPDAAEPGYGYITPAQALRVGGDVAFQVQAFQEKPSAESAARLCRQGGLWNSFVMLFRLDRLLAIIRSAVPEELHRMATIAERPDLIQDGYLDLPAWNFSSRVLAHIPQYMVVVAVDDVYWSDWGTFSSIERTITALNLTPAWWVSRQQTAAA